MVETWAWVLTSVALCELGVDSGLFAEEQVKIVSRWGRATRVSSLSRGVEVQAYISV